ncbi:carbon-nitrogen hydrolase family protein [Actinomycetospora straminea]|uniref:Carbon-nitrogen hydrolase family protein n=1 Tax=Actinomycetospora straminea TaxID=663607 RepID=A0ABP9EU60_9PSEU|nr:carbon-nitrogen hydrolase family protein [Actinomycetospora straminea]MDD7933298.1 carbon-nitrogen hydrolase family protein [Actinomycetospora straminea]
MTNVVRVAAVQAEPRWLDIDAGVEQVVGYIADAAAQGVALVSFGETFIPGYPWWIWLDAPAAGMQYVHRYHQNSMTRDGEHMARIAAAAAEHRVWVVLGFSERAGGSVYMAQAFISDTGRVVSVRRKLKPTHVERSVFGEGDGSDIQVHETPLGRLGALNCWEHFQPLTKYAMYSLGEQIHVAAWPSFSVYRGGARALGPEVNNAASLVYAVEGQTFVVAPCSVVGQAAHDLYCDTETKRQLLLQGGGFARVFGPEGTPLGEDLAETEEGLVVADLDFSLISIAKSAADPVGHYSRPDVMRLLINRTPNSVVVEQAAPALPRFVDAEELGRPASVPAETG